MKLSVVIPVRNGGEDFHRCLRALKMSTRPPDEIIVVDDASTDSSAAVAATFGALLLSQAEFPLGPAKARNRGAAMAQGDVLIFVDADVMVHQDTLAAIETYLTSHPEVTALFGSYDDAPLHRGVVSLYKNLQHHFVHQQGNEEASTFWAGLGAIRRGIFVKMGGFDEYYARPSIEDIELGMRLRRAGYQIRLCPDIQAKHLKQWTFLSWLRSDIFDRAVPWTKLIISTAALSSDLNLDYKSRLSTVCAWAFLFCLGVGYWFHLAWAGALLLLGLLIMFNFSLYRFFMRYGFWFALEAFALHLLYFCYSSLTFVAIWLMHVSSQAHDQMITLFKSDKFVGGFYDKK